MLSFLLKLLGLEVCGGKFHGEDARYWFLYPAPEKIAKITSLLDGLPYTGKTKQFRNPAPSRKMSGNETAAQIEKWLWESYAGELLDVTAGEDCFFAGYYVFVERNTLSVLVCYMGSWNEGALFWGMDIARRSETEYEVWIPESDHAPEEIGRALAAVKDKIERGVWEDVCCGEPLREQLRVWAAERNKTL